MSFAEYEKIKMSQLQAMELFVSAAREGSFSAAGRHNGLSPASVSRRIGELEARLGVQLFNRTTRHLALTEAGKAYLQRVEPALHSIEDAAAAALALQSTPRGTLRVHSRMLFGMTVVMPLMPAVPENVSGAQGRVDAFRNGVSSCARRISTSTCGSPRRRMRA